MCLQTDSRYILDVRSNIISHASGLMARDDMKNLGYQDAREEKDDKKVIEEMADYLAQNYVAGCDSMFTLRGQSSASHDEKQAARAAYNLIISRHYPAATI